MCTDEEGEIANLDERVITAALSYIVTNSQISNQCGTSTTAKGFLCTCILQSNTHLLVKKLGIETGIRKKAYLTSISSFLNNQVKGIDLITKLSCLLVDDAGADDVKLIKTSLIKTTRTSSSLYI